MEHACPLCGAQALTEQIGSTPFVGAVDVHIDGVSIWSCAACGERLTELPALRSLVDRVVRAVAGRAGRLEGIELRLLRQHLGWSAAEAARQLGVDPATVSRWEGGHRSMSLPAEKLLRLAVAARHGEVRDGALAALLAAPEAGPRAPIRLPAVAPGAVGSPTRAVADALRPHPHLAVAA